MATSMTMCLQALGHRTNEDEVNKVMGATPSKGAAWEQALATAQHYGCRATLTVPATVNQLKGWTDAGNPVMIAWNPEGRDWSHASTVFDVTEGLPEAIPAEAVVQGEGPGLYIWVADSNIPHPEKTTRICHEDFFYSKWYEKWPRYLVRRPAMAVEREITPGGRQVMASSKTARHPLVTQAINFAKQLGTPMNLPEMVAKYGKVEMEAALGMAIESGDLSDREVDRALTAMQQIRRSRMASKTASAAIKDLHGKLFSRRRGLEGPFKYKTGVVLYYDPREGSYYDPSRDLYISIQDFMEMTGEFPRKASAGMASRISTQKLAWRPDDPAEKKRLAEAVRRVKALIDQGWASSQAVKNVANKFLDPTPDDAIKNKYALLLARAYFEEHGRFPDGGAWGDFRGRTTYTSWPRQARTAYTMTAKDAAKWVRKLNGRYAEDLAAELSESERSALLDYIAHTRIRTPRNPYTEAKHAQLTEAQRVLLSAGRRLRRERMAASACRVAQAFKRRSLGER
jgi:hypothetical protein